MSNSQQPTANSQQPTANSQQHRSSIITFFLFSFYIIFFLILDYNFFSYIKSDYMSFIYLILILPIFIFNKILYIKIYTILLFILFYIIYFISAGHYILFDAGFNSISFASLFDTNFLEAIEFSSHLLTSAIIFKIFLVFSVFILIFGVVFRYAKAINISKKTKKINIVLILIFIFGLFIFYKNMPFYVICREYYNYKKELAEMNVLKSEYKFNKFKDIKEIYKVSPQANKKTFVIVIGESVDRKHMGCYGYKRDNTKYTDSINNIFYFNNVISPHTQTLISLSEVLTFAYDDKKDNVMQKGSIINYFNDAGFKTFWISNQYSAGEYDNFIATIGKNAKDSIFINKNSWKSLKAPYDEDLLPYFENALNDTAENKVIFIHLMGSHYKYYRRYPNTFYTFKPEKNTKRQNKLAHYDNSILYTDYILFQIINKLKQKDDLSYMLYFADHGEDVYDNEYCPFDHTEARATKHMYDIPVMLWLSDKYIYNFGETKIIDKIKNAKNIPYNSQLMPDTILQISNLTNEDADLQKSILAYYPKPSEYSSDRKIDIPKNGIWLHRTNNREKLIRNFDKYTGFEMDIRFNEQENYFNVDHDKDNGNETLLDMLKNIKGIENKYFWLDFKNLSKSNKEKSLNLLNKITDELKINRNHIIIEAKEQKELNIFKEAGYYTSFYLSCYSWEKTDKYIDYIQNDIRKLSESTVDFVSSDSKYFDIVCYYFPKANHLFWYLGQNKYTENKYIFNKDEQVYVVLNEE